MNPYKQPPVKSIKYEPDLSQIQREISRIKKDAIGQICNYLARKGNLTDIDDVPDDDKFIVTYIDDIGYPAIANYRQVDVENNGLEILLSDGHWLYTWDINLSHIEDVMNILSQKLGKHIKPPKPKTHEPR